MNQNMNQKSQKDLLTYEELLKKLENSRYNRLLLGNGFNNSLGIKTNDSEIFSQMKKEYPRYTDEEYDFFNKTQKIESDFDKVVKFLKNKRDKQHE